MYNRFTPYNITETPPPSITFFVRHTSETEMYECRGRYMIKKKKILHKRINISVHVIYIYIFIERRCNYYFGDYKHHIYVYLRFTCEIMY